MDSSIRGRRGPPPLDRARSEMVGSRAERSPPRAAVQSSDRATPDSRSVNDKQASTASAKATQDFARSCRGSLREHHRLPTPAAESRLTMSVVVSSKCPLHQEVSLCSLSLWERHLSWSVKSCDLEFPSCPN